MVLAVRENRPVTPDTELTMTCEESPEFELPDLDMAPGSSMPATRQVTFSTYLVIWLS